MCLGNLAESNLPVSGRFDQSLRALDEDLAAARKHSLVDERMFVIFLNLSVMARSS